MRGTTKEVAGGKKGATKSRMQTGVRSASKSTVKAGTSKAVHAEAAHGSTGIGGRKAKSRKSVISK